jgi:YebC/PmpR family DNA-binding regulatory protein
MSGHSKWAKIKHKKGVKDIKKGAVYTKLARNITLAASEGGADLEMNFSLRLAISKAKAVNMPSDNIDRAIKKASGGDSKISMQKVSYEAMVGNVGLIVDCQTDNVNRSVAEVKKILENHGSKMANIGSVSWNFVEKGLINVRIEKIIKSTKFGVEDSFLPVQKEEAELELMEVEGVDDLKDAEGQDSEDSEPYPYIEIITEKHNLKTVYQKITELGFHVDAFELVKIPNDYVSVTEGEREKVENIIEALEESDDVDEIWTNME